MSKYQTKQTGRPYAEVRGYLRDTLAAPTVASNVLTPESATLAVYALSAAGDWRHVGEAVVWSYDETLSGVVGSYVRASLNADDRFEVFWVSCSATSLTVPAAP